MIAHLFAIDAQFIKPQTGDVSNCRVKLLFQLQIFAKTAGVAPAVDLRTLQPTRFPVGTRAGNPCGSCAPHFLRPEPSLTRIILCSNISVAHQCRTHVGDVDGLAGKNPPGIPEATLAEFRRIRLCANNHAVGLLKRSANRIVIPPAKRGTGQSIPRGSGSYSQSICSLSINIKSPLCRIYPRFWNALGFQREIQPFTAPAVMPATMYFWQNT